MMTSVPATASGLADLQPFLWENRLILIRTSADQAAALQSQLNNANAEIKDRHIVWFIFTEDQVISNHAGPIDDALVAAVSDRWQVAQLANQQVILVGKDGGSKLFMRALDLAEIFVTIDGMPMRQYEMRQAAEG